MALTRGVSVFRRPLPISSRYLLLAAGILPVAAGCPAITNLPAPGRILELHEPVTERTYFLYVPTCHDLRTDRPCPLVVCCHGMPPFDTARRQLDEWKGLAEREGFLLAALELSGTSRLGRNDQQLRRHYEDERAILGVVRSVRASHRVADTRVFLTGWSAGGYAVLFTGLRHPEVFRAIAVRQGNFEPEFVMPTVPFLDPHQPVLIRYSPTDILAQREPPACADWLREHGMNPTVEESDGPHRRNPYSVFRFFKSVVRTRPWIRIEVEDDAADPQTVTLRLRCSFSPRRVRWDLGDGQGSAELVCRHTYDKPGRYLVRVAVWSSSDRYHIRRTELIIPRARLGIAPPTTTQLAP